MATAEPPGTRSQARVEASGWTITAMYGTPNVPDPTPEPTPTPTPEVGLGGAITLYATVGDTDLEKIVGGTVRVSTVKAWKGNEDHEPSCEGCRIITAKVAVRGADNLSDYGDGICVTANQVIAVGKDGTEVPGSAMRQPTYGACSIIDGEMHEGWVSFDVPSGFKLHRLRYITDDSDYVVVKPSG